jgi:hypothetical protein
MTSVDPQTAIIRQLGALLGKLGELQTPPEGSTVVQGITKNIADLAQVLCSENNAEKFLKFNAEPRADMNVESTAVEARIIKAEEEAGTLAHILVSTVSTLPLQTPSYAALTLAVNELAPKPSYSGFASRCVTYAMHQFSSDMDALLLASLSVEERSRTQSRMKHVLRYLALLGRLTIVLSHQEDDVTGPPKTLGLTLAGFLQMLTTASVKAATYMQQLPTACLLAQLVLSTIPHVHGTISNTYLMEQVLEPLETSVLNSETYKSSFVPGVGRTALLLKEEQFEEEDDEEEDDDDDEEEEEEENASGQRCDTLQDLLRSVRVLLRSEDKDTQFSLLTDAPWEGLKAPPVAPWPEVESYPPQEPLVNTNVPIRLSLSPDCRSILCLLSDCDDGSVEFQCFDLDGVVFGRLPIFGSPSEDQFDDNGDDDDDDDNMDTQTNEQLQTYQKQFGLLDRYFLADSVRDCLLSHQSHVSAAGLERGSAKDVAQQLWSICHLFSQKGIEYGITEQLMSLIMQANNEGAYRNMFVSRVLLELTRLQPSIMPQALALAISNIVSYYLPALVPSARDNFSRWFSFHLINTDYQWPAGYWEHWATYVTNGKRSSRGDFVLRILSIMASRVNEVQTIVTDCLAQGSVLAKYLIVDEQGGDSIEDDPFASIERDLVMRIWEKSEDPDSLRSYIVGDEVAESIAAAGNLSDENGNVDKIWWRTRVAVRALLDPATREQVRQRQAVQRLLRSSGDKAIEEDDSSNSEDVLAMLIENFVRYRPMLLATIAHDAKNPTYEDDQLAAGKVFVLNQLESGLRHSRVLLESCVKCLAENDIVSGEMVMRWALGDNDFKGSTVVVERWWEFAETAVRVGIANALSGLDTQSKDNPKLFEMDVSPSNEKEDGRENLAARRMTAILEQVDPIIRYMIKRVCDLLQQSGDGKRKLTPLDVDLVEGCRLVILAVKSLVLSRLKEEDSSFTPVTNKEAQDLWSQCNVCGSHLASSCSDQRESSSAVDALVASLYAM